MKSKSLFVIAVIVWAVMAPAAMVHATTLYSETFDVGTTEGQSVLAAPLNWVAGWGQPYTQQVVSNLHPGWTSRALDGSTGAQGTTDALFKQVLSSTPTSGTFVLSFNAYAASSTAGDATMGAQGSYVGLSPTSSTGDSTDWEARWADTGHLQWGFHVYSPDLSASSTMFLLPMDIGFSDASTVLKIFVNMDSKQIWGSVATSGGTYDTPKYSITAANPDIDTFGLFNELGGTDSNPGFRSGIDIDNLTVQTVPEPSALLGIMTGLISVAGMLRRRKAA